MRAFIGIDLESGMKKDVRDLQQKLRLQAEKGRWKHSDNFHLTLKFLDEISPDQKQQIDDAMMQLCTGTRPFNLALSDLGIFPGREDVRVLWLGLTGDMKELQTLYAEVNKVLTPMGFSPENRSYSPHITLGQDIIFRSGFNGVKGSIGEVKLPAFTVRSLYLFKSEQVQNKRIYTRVSEYKLK